MSPRFSLVQSTWLVWPPEMWLPAPLATWCWHADVECLPPCRRWPQIWPAGTSGRRTPVDRSVRGRFWVTKSLKKVLVKVIKKVSSLKKSTQQSIMLLKKLLKKVRKNTQKSKFTQKSFSKKAVQKVNLLKKCGGSLTRARNQRFLSELLVYLKNYHQGWFCFF